MAVAGSIAFSEQVFVNKGHRPVRKFIMDWTSDSSGDVTEIPTDGHVSGAILRVVTVPSATAAPSDNYDVTCLDENGVDIFAGQGANRDTANAEHFKPGVPFKDGTTTSTDVICIDDILTLTVDNAGDTKQGRVVIYLR